MIELYYEILSNHIYQEYDHIQILHNLLVLLEELG